jgi:hypothetical protein
MIIALSAYRDPSDHTDAPYRAAVNGKVLDEVQAYARVPKRFGTVDLALQAARFEVELRKNAASVEVMA